MEPKIILCTGGARSGKSEFAERLAQSLYMKKHGAGDVSSDAVIDSKQAGLLYVATGQAFDDEMKGRIANHKHRRGTRWETHEIPLALEEHWSQVMDGEGSIILLDCLTMYVTNYVLQLSDPITSEAVDALQECLTNEFDRIIESTRAHHKTLIMVTNEVGSGIVPDNALSRHFRDVAGYLNQHVAAAADEVYLTVSGITIEVKSKEVHI